MKLFKWEAMLSTYFYNFSTAIYPDTLILEVTRFLHVGDYRAITRICARGEVGICIFNYIYIYIYNHIQPCLLLLKKVEGKSL